MGCCGPSTCCTFNDYPQKKDACMCGCGYMNGMCAILTAQFFTLVGAVLSLATLGDCAFANIAQTLTLDLSSSDDTDTDTNNNESSSGSSSSLTKDVRGVGFITFETLDGHCYWYGEGITSDAGNQLDQYWNILGTPWQIGMSLTWFCAIFSWYFFLYTISYCCSSQVKCCRYLNGFCLSVVLVIAQACTFITYGSSFCDEYECSFGRTAGYSLGAILCYLISGLAFFLSSDYPGENYDRNKDTNNIQDVTDSDVVYHPDPELNSTEDKEAARISQQLGGSGGGGDGENYTTNNITTRSIGEGGEDGDGIDSVEPPPSGEYTQGTSVQSMNNTGPSPVDTSPAEPIDDDADNHPTVTAQY